MRSSSEITGPAWHTAARAQRSETPPGGTRLHLRAHAGRVAGGRLAPPGRPGPARVLVTPITDCGCAVLVDRDTGGRRYRADGNVHAARLRWSTTALADACSQFCAGLPSTTGGSPPVLSPVGAAWVGGACVLGGSVAVG